MERHNILVVDDDPDIANMISLYLESAGYNSHIASNSTEALEKANSMDFSLMILDMMLPDYNGDLLCKKIRETVYCPIIFVSCIDQEEFILNAFESGGDDYIRKPFNPKELLARVESNLRRIEYDSEDSSENKDFMVAGDLKIDPSEGRVFRGDTEIELSPLEFDILKVMAENPDKTLSCSWIYKSVWDSEYDEDIRTVMVHISNLRKKLDESDMKKYIVNIKKKGYRLIV